MASHGPNYVRNERLHFSQYGAYATSAAIIPWYSYPASLENQTEIPIELLC